MSEEKSTPLRFIGLDVHKYYLIAIGVDARQAQVFGPQRVPMAQLDEWRAKHLTRQDALVLETTTNAFQLYDDLSPHVHSVTLVHPPHVALITRAAVKTDPKAALALAQLHAAGLLPPVWVPPPEVRAGRALVAQRNKMTRLTTQAKNRLHAVLHRHHLSPPAGGPFLAEQRAWWLALPVTALEHVRIESDLDTLAFAEHQQTVLVKALMTEAAHDERIPLLVQLPGISTLTALTLLAAIGDIRRFEDAPHLVGYAGLGARVHTSGLTHRTGGITKEGRRDLRSAMVEAAQTAANTHPHWQKELARLEPRLGRNKAIVAIARKLLVAVWHVLTYGIADRFAEPDRVARKFLQHAYHLGQANRPKEQTPAAYVRDQLDRLELGMDLDTTGWGPRKQVKLPPSRLTAGRGPKALDPTRPEAGEGNVAR